MSYSFTVKDTDGGNEIDMATYGVVVIGGQWPLIPDPQSQTINLAAKDGGYTYNGAALPGTFSLLCTVDTNQVDLTNLFSVFDQIAAALPTDQYKQIHIDGVTDRYWVGVRVAGVMGDPVGNRAVVNIQLVFRLDDPNPTMIGT